jgi:hypothetical protein
MPNPTTTYSWQLPVEGEDPWATQFYSAVGQVDASLAAVQQLGRLRRRMTVVLSAYPTAPTTYASTTSWSTISYAPFGPLRGAFTVVTSARVRFDFTVNVQRVTSKPAFRVVLNGSRVSSFTFAADSEWLLDAGAGGDEFHAAAWFTRVVSLGAGTYTAELQTRNTVAINPTVIGSSDRILLTVRETAL